MKTTSPDPAVPEVWVSSTWTKRTWAIQKNTLDGRDVVKRKAPAGNDEYSLLSVTKKCADLICQRLTADTDQAAMLHGAKQAKELEELRKLRLANAVKSGEVVQVATVQAGIATSLRALTDKLESIPTKVRMGVADVAPNDLAAISHAIAAKRNQAAEHERTADNG